MWFERGLPHRKAGGNPLFFVSLCYDVAMSITREELADVLDRYEKSWAEPEMVKKFRRLIADEPRCAERDCYPAHLTASAMVVTPDFSKMLLTHHKKLGKWLQLGGHADGSFDMPGTALRETTEESGLEKVRVYSWREDDAAPVLDLDAHWIPDGKEPGHWHYDVRYVVIAEEPEKIVLSPESIDLKWFDLEEAFALCQDTSIVRLIRKLDGLARKVVQ
jgi:8-oxo-dGTP pyrophosphatase MutT (NUDIX family)